MKPVTVLNHVSLAVPRKGVFGLLGANGAGKTTLIHLIAGLRTPTSGQVLVLGAPARQPAARMRLGYLPERPYFYEHLTAEQFLIFHGQLSGMSRTAVQKQIPEVLKTVHLLHARSSELRTFSKGMLQRVGIAQSILHGPDLLVLDEPMSGLDPGGRHEMRQLIAQLGHDRTVFFSSHILEDLEAICDSVALIHNGHIVTTGTLKDLLEKDRPTFEIGCAGIDSAEWTRNTVLKKIQQRSEVSEGTQLTLPPDVAVEPVVQEVIQLGGKILWVRPRRKRLEDLARELTQ